jgi:TrmH family RNA methyltransferase
LKLLTAARDLKRRKARERNTLFVVEGVRATEELLRSPITTRGALVTAALAEGERGHRLLEALRRVVPEVLEVEEPEMESAAHTDSPQGVLVIADVPERALNDVVVAGRTRILLLDGVQDPGNAGALVRTAAALGAAATIALPGTVDLWSAKVVRSAMGTQFHHAAMHADLKAVEEFLDRNGIPLWGSESGAPDVAASHPAPERLALAVGNEGSGLSPVLRARIQRLVGVPTRAGVESLNVTVAAGIILYELSR